MFTFSSGKSNEVYEVKDVEPIGSSNDLATAIATANTGKATQLPITTSKNLSPHITTCKRNSMNLHNFHHPIDAKKPIIRCNCSSASSKRSTNERAHLKDSCELNQCMTKESFSCDSISKSSFVTASGPYTDTDQSTNSSRSPKSLATSCSPSGNFIATPNPSTGAISPIISLSKSETNISDSNADDNRNQLTIYNVVSLNNLNDTEPFFYRTLNDQTKNQCLANSSENDLFNNSPKKQTVTLPSPKLISKAVTVSMRNAADVSDKVF